VDCQPVDEDVTFKRLVTNKTGRLVYNISGDNDPACMVNDLPIVQRERIIETLVIDIHQVNHVLA